MSTGSSEDRRRCLADELEEGEIAPDGYHSSPDTEDYYNRDAAFSGESDGGIISVATAPSATENHNWKGNTSTPSAAVSHNRKGNTSAPSAAASHNRKGNISAPYAAARHNWKGNTSAPSTAARNNRKGNTSRSSAAASHNLKGNTSRPSAAASHNWNGNTSAPSAAARHNWKGNTSTPSTAASHKWKDNTSTPSAAAIHKWKSKTSASPNAANHNPKGNDGASCPAANHVAEAGVNANLMPPTEPVVRQQPAPPPAGNQARRVVCIPDVRTYPDPTTCRKWSRTHQALGGHMSIHWKGDRIIVPKKKKIRIQQLPPPADAQVASPTLALPIKAESQSLDESAMDAVQQATAAVAEGTPESAVVPRATGRVMLFGVDIGSGVRTPPAEEGSPATKDATSTLDRESQSLAPAKDAAQAQPATAAVAEDTPGPATGPRVTRRVMLFGVDIGSGVRTPPPQEGSSASTGGKQQ